MATIKFDDQMTSTMMRFAVNTHAHVYNDRLVLIEFNKKQAAAFITAYAINHAQIHDKIKDDQADEMDTKYENAMERLEGFKVYDFYDSDSYDEEPGDLDNPDGGKVRPCSGSMYPEGDVFVLVYEGAEGEMEMGVEDSDVLYKHCIKFLKGSNVPEEANLVK